MTSSGTELGSPIGLGRTAEVFAWGDDQVVKVLRPGFPDRFGEHEAAVAALVEAAGVGAPRFLGTTRIEGRVGIIYERLVGASMLDRLGRHPWEIDRLARRFADLHATMHGANGEGLPDQKAGLREMIDRAGSRLPDGARQAALARLAGLPDGDAICHGDMHPGNVLLAGRGAVVLDWVTASAGRPAGDVARTLLLIDNGSVPPHMPRAQRALLGLARRRFGRTYLRRYQSHRPLDLREVDAWRLPLLAGRLAEGIEEERESLDALIRGELDRPSPRAG